MSRVRTMSGHRGRVGTMAWSSHLLSSGSRDRNILQRDIRAPEDFQHKLLGHRSEVRTSEVALTDALQNLHVKPAKPSIILSVFTVLP